MTTEPQTSDEPTFDEIAIELGAGIAEGLMQALQHPVASPERIVASRDLVLFGNKVRISMTLEFCQEETGA
jgi:hypothetical protein